MAWHASKGEASSRSLSTKSREGWEATFLFLHRCSGLVTQRPKCQTRARTQCKGVHLSYCPVRDPLRLVAPRERYGRRHDQPDLQFAVGVQFRGFVHLLAKCLTQTSTLLTNPPSECPQQQWRRILLRHCSELPPHHQSLTQCRPPFGCRIV